MTVSGIVEKIGSDGGVSLREEYDVAVKRGFDGNFQSYLRNTNQTEFVVVFDRPIILDHGGMLAGGQITPETIGMDQIREGDRVWADYRLRGSEATISRIGHLSQPKVRSSVHPTPQGTAPA